MSESSKHAEEIIATAARIFKRKNQQQELDILIQSDPSINWVGENWGVDYGDLYLHVPFDTWQQIDEYHEKLQNTIKEEINTFIRGHKEEINNVYIVPKLEAAPNWREDIRSLSDTQFGIPPKDSQYDADIFMLMSFANDELQQVYEDHIVKLASTLGLTIKRGDDFFSHTSVMQDIWAAINAARVIIADCTLRNPNVFYELGIAHTVGKKTIMITRDKDDIPFDLRQYRYIDYEFTPRGMNQFESELTRAIQNLLDRPLQNNNQVDDISDIPF